jgi:hypothetical protein
VVCEAVQEWVEAEDGWVILLDASQDVGPTSFLYLHV